MTGRPPRLALAIPARNATGHLPRLMNSVRAQTVPFDEVWVYDDASTDDTGAMARMFGATVVRTDVNSGPSVGKSVLAAHTTAEWIHFHDADDALGPEFVARTRQWLSEPGTDVVLFGTQDRDDLTGAVVGERRWNNRELRADAVRYCIQHTVTNCGVYRRTAFLDAGGFDTSEDTKYNEDRAMHLRLALAGLRFRAEDYLGVIIYRRQNSMSSGHPIECARAHYHVLANAAERTGVRYAPEIGRELWTLAGVSGTYLDWAYVKRCLDLAGELGYTDPAGENVLFRALARIHPFGAVAARERYIRWFKSGLRTAVPRVS